MGDLTDEQERLVVERLARSATQLNDQEKMWRDKQPFLESRGYMLRPRLRPGWIPSWTVTGDVMHAEACEDYQPMPVGPSSTVDATRMSDGRLVCVKRVQTGGTEVKINLMLASKELQKLPNNHCVPVLDIFQDDSDPTGSYLVMPFLRKINNPPFELVHDIIDVIDQLLKGLVFLHSHGVAHRDCAYKNLMMDASVLYPEGFHPIQQRFAPTDMNRRAWHYSRFTVPKPVKYYYIDFGLSSHFPDDQQPKLVVGHDGLDQDPPELSTTVPYDPFKLDVFILGNVLKTKICQQFTNLAFLSPLVETMTANDPAKRPTASAALQQWQQLRKRIHFPTQLLQLKLSDPLDRVISDRDHYRRLGPMVCKRVYWWFARALHLVR